MEEFENVLGCVCLGCLELNGGDVGGVDRRADERAGDGDNLGRRFALLQAVIHGVEADLGRGGRVRLDGRAALPPAVAVSYTHLRAHETVQELVCRLLLEKKNKKWV